MLNEVIARLRVGLAVAVRMMRVEMRVRRLRRERVVGIVC